MSDDTAMALAIAADQLSGAHKRIAELKYERDVFARALDKRDKHVAKLEEEEAYPCAGWSVLHARRTSEPITKNGRLVADIERIAELEKALREIRDSPYCDYESQPATSYGTGVVDGHRYCSTIARKALETGE